jgi:beta-glucosidase
MFILIFIVILIIILYKWYLSRVHSSLYWCWDDGNGSKRVTINTDNISFPEQFLWGTASCSYQCEGPGDKPPVASNWSEWEPEGIKDGQRCGMTVDHYHRYKEDIQLMSNLGCNAYRFSLAWDKIEAIEGKYDQEILAHYHDVLKELKRQSIKPMITFHHFVHPFWFEERSAFLVEANISTFVRFAVDMFREFENECQLWCTINEPGVVVGGGYLAGIFPPGHTGELNEVSLVLQHFLQAHIEVYDGIKKIAHQPEQHSVGIVKELFQFDPYNPWSPLDVYLCHVFDYALNESVLNFFRTGTFKWKMPWSIHRTYKNTRAPYANDFIGLNYYSHFRLRFNVFKPPFIENIYQQGNGGYPLMTDMPYPLYPEGLYRACLRLKAKLPRVPIYITENGIADRLDDRRHLFFRRYLYALSRAINEGGCDVRGYFYWSLTDNFEWAEVIISNMDLFFFLDYHLYFRVLILNLVCIMLIYKHKNVHYVIVLNIFKMLSKNIGKNIYKSFFCISGSIFPVFHPIARL